MLDFSKAIKGEKEDHYYVSVTQVSREFIFFIEVLKMFHPLYKSKRHGPIQNKQTSKKERRVSAL